VIAERLLCQLLMVLSATSLVACLGGSKPTPEGAPCRGTMDEFGLQDSDCGQRQLCELSFCRRSCRQDFMCPRVGSACINALDHVLFNEEGEEEAEGVCSLPREEDCPNIPCPPLLACSADGICRGYCQFDSEALPDDSNSVENACPEPLTCVRSHNVEQPPSPWVGGVCTWGQQW